MRKILAYLTFSAVVAVIVLATRQSFVKPSAPAAERAVTAAPVATPPSATPPASASPAPPDPLLALDRKLSELTDQLSYAEKELENAGFPTILRDEHLNPTLREEVLAKLAKASALHDEVVALKLKKIDLEADRKWAN